MSTLEDHMLFVLAEECAEVAKEGCKAGRFGLDDRNPLLAEAAPQRAMIRHELADLLAVVEMMVELRMIENPMELRAEMQEKKRKVLRYLGYARDAGALSVGQAARAEEIIAGGLDEVSQPLTR
jgi:NTP pyrophosphatase (non-canonical NTP hydrolase)